MSGWDRVLHPEKAIGTVFAISGLLRAVAWWIDRDLARRAVPAHIRESSAREHRSAQRGTWYDEPEVLEPAELNRPARATHVAQTHEPFELRLVECVYCDAEQEDWVCPTCFEQLPR